LALWQRRFKDPRLFTLIAAIVRCYRNATGKGLPIGSLTSQHLANFYLGWLDRFVKEQLGIHGYVRYMDDIAIWLPDGPEAKRVEREVRGFLADKLDLQPKPEPYSNRTAHGMDFLGSRLFPTHMVPNRRSRLRFRQKWQALAKAHRLQTLSDREFQNRATSLVSFLKTEGMSSWHFRKRTLHQEW
jgi:hypothetical protein